MFSNLNKHLSQMAMGKLSVPRLDEYNPPDNYWYPHPPCLIPLFLGYGASYKGFIRHFFSNRKETFVEYSLENGYFSEIARNENQLYTLMILQMITINDGINDDIIRFCKAINYSQLEAVDKFSIKYGEDLKKGRHLVYYNQDTPFKYIEDINDYNGDFPSSLTVLNLSRLNNACSFEISNRRLLENIDIPVWLRNDIEKKQLFDEFIAKGLLKEAWFTLNSQGWRLDDVEESLLVLKKKANNEYLHLVADNWIHGWKHSDFKENSYY